MKKILIIVMSSLLILGAVAMIFLHIFRNKQVVGDFQLSNYNWAIDSFPSDKYVGDVENYKTVIEKAKGLWMEQFSETYKEYDNLNNGGRIEVSYDAENECWYVSGTLPINMKGGVPHALIQKDGKVLAIWHDQ